MEITEEALKSNAKETMLDLAQFISDKDLEEVINALIDERYERPYRVKINDEILAFKGKHKPKYPTFADPTL